MPCPGAPNASTALVKAFWLGFIGLTRPALPRGSWERAAGLDRPGFSRPVPVLSAPCLAGSANGHRGARAPARMKLSNLCRRCWSLRRSRAQRTALRLPQSHPCVVPGSPPRHPGLCWGCSSPLAPRLGGLWQLNFRRRNLGLWSSAPGSPRPPPAPGCQRVPLPQRGLVPQRNALAPSNDTVTHIQRVPSPPRWR